MSIVLFEDHGYTDLLPLVYSRATFNLRCGMENLRDKVENAYGRPIAAMYVRPAIAPVMAERWGLPVNSLPSARRLIWINGRALVRTAIELEPDTAIWEGDTLIAANMSAAMASTLTIETLMDPTRLVDALSSLRRASAPDGSYALIRYPWNLIRHNGDEITRRLSQADHGVVIGRLYDGVHILNEAAVWIGKGAVVKPCTVLDAEEGPIHIGEGAKINPNVTISGPCFIGDNCVVQSGANIRGGTSIGASCKVGGEIEGTIFHGYSNKQHDGFVGHSYVGEWVNLGADTVTSDLKNTYGPVKVAINGRDVDSGEMFVGSIIGDHAKTGIHTTLPTGCVIGYASNIFTSAHAPRFTASFSWLTDAGRAGNDPPRALAVALKVVARRNRAYSETEQRLFLSIAEQAKRIEHA